MAVEATQIWSTNAVDELVAKFKRTGVMPEKNPFFKSQIGKRKAGIIFGYTKEELLELLKCESDIVYFAENFCKILTKKGRQIIKDVGGLRPYQKKMLRQYQNNKYNITLASRQVGKSITVGIYICWYILFNSDANLLLLSETGAKAKDLLLKIKNIQDSQPFYMQRGVEYTSTQKRSYDNGCTLISENTTENTGVSGSYEFVYWDEMALLSEEMQDTIFTGLFPTMSSFGDKAKFIITSTPRGRNNKFYRIWAGAIADKDSPEYLPFAYSRVFWHENKDNTPEWAKGEKKLMGEAGFAREYDLSFDADEDLLVSAMVKQLISDSSVVYEPQSKEYPLSSLRVKPDFDIADFSDPSRRFHISIDLASGKDGKRDFTVFNIFEIVMKSHKEIKAMEFFENEGDFFKQVQVGIIRSNKIKVEDMAKILYSVLLEAFTLENVRLTVEMNHKGDHFLSSLFNYLGNKNELKEHRDDLVVCYPLHLDFDDEKRVEEGLMQTPKSKKYTVENINIVLENRDIEISEATTVEEGLSFGKDKKGNYKGLGEHDDHFMTVLNASAFKKTEVYFDFVDELYNMLYKDEKEIVEVALNRSSGLNDDDDDDIYDD